MNRLVTILMVTLCFIFFVIAGWLKIIHADIADTLLLPALISSYVCLSVVLFQLMFSMRTGIKNKILLLVAFMATGWLAVFYYLYVSRNRIWPVVSAGCLMLKFSNSYLLSLHHKKLYEKSMAIHLFDIVLFQCFSAGHVWTKAGYLPT